MVSLVILDIDGVLTDGKKYYNSEGLPFSKIYCDQDFTAIKRFRGSNINVCFLSGDENINKNMAKNRNIDFYSSRGLKKSSFLSNLCATYNSAPENIVYIGDDLFDLDIMKLVGYPFCPSNACRDVKNLCGVKGVLTNKGGENVVAELFNTLLDRNLIQDCTMEDIEKLDKKEVF